MHSSNWDNLRFVLCVAQHGSVSAAARVLGVNHATVLRRVAAFEHDQGGAIFERTATGYTVLPDRVRVIEAAREVENAVYSVERLMHGARAPLRGLVRISSTDTMCQRVLPALMERLQRDASQMRIELLSNNSPLDFAKLQADISVRPAVSLSDDLVGDSSARLGFAPYARSDSDDRWLGLGGPLARSLPAAWIAAHVPADQIANGADSFMVLREMALSGQGIAVLPVVVGDGVPGLMRLRDRMPAMSVPLWVASHADLRDVSRIRIVRDKILAYLGGIADVLDAP